MKKNLKNNSNLVVVETEQIVSFNINNEEFAVNILNIQEIIKIQQITEVPLSKKYVEGVTNIRGNIIPIINLRVKMGLEKIPFDAETRIIIISYENRKVGAIVDSMNEVLRIPVDKITTPTIRSELGRDRFMEALCILEDRIITILNINNILDTL